MKMFHFTIGHLSGINIPVQIYSNELVGELWIDTSNVLKAELGQLWPNTPPLEDQRT